MDIKDRFYLAWVRPIENMWQEDHSEPFRTLAEQVRHLDAASTWTPDAVMERFWQFKFDPVLRATNELKKKSPNDPKGIYSDDYSFMAYVLDHDHLQFRAFDKMRIFFYKPGHYCMLNMAVDHDLLNGKEPRFYENMLDGAQLFCISDANQNDVSAVQSLATGDGELQTVLNQLHATLAFHKALFGQ